MDFLEQLIAEQIRRDKKFQDIEDANKAKVLAAGFSEQDFKMALTIFAFLKDMSESHGFLSIMCTEFEHLPSAKLMKQHTQYMREAAKFLHRIIDVAGLDDSLFQVQSMEHTNACYDNVDKDTDRVIQKHETLRSLIH